MRLLEDKTAFVTGAASGIGLAVARKFAVEGASVAIADISLERASEAAERLRADGFDCEPVACDVTQEAQFAAAIASVQARRGKLDILVNNAGLQHVALIEDFPVDQFEKMLKVMLTGAFIGIKYAFSLMKQRRYGRIINMASINGIIGFAGKAAYNSAKHGLIGLTKVAALEGGQYGITVNALCPGYVDTPLVRGQLEQLAVTRGVPLELVLEEVIYPLVPQRRLLDAEEIADYAALAASDKLRGVTGSSLIIDGGYTAQ